MNSYKKDNPIFHLQNKQVKLNQAQSFQKQTNDLTNFIASKRNKQQNEQIESYSFSDIGDAVLGLFGKVSKETALEGFEDLGFSEVITADSIETVDSIEDGFIATLKNGDRYTFREKNGRVQLERFQDILGNSFFFEEDWLKGDFFGQLYRGESSIMSMEFVGDQLKINMEYGESYIYSSSNPDFPLRIDTPNYQYVINEQGLVNLERTTDNMLIMKDGQGLSNRYGPYINDDSVLVPIGQDLYIINQDGIVCIDPNGNLKDTSGEDASYVFNFRNIVFQAIKQYEPSPH